MPIQVNSYGEERSQAAFLMSWDVNENVCLRNRYFRDERSLGLRTNVGR